MGWRWKRFVGWIGVVAVAWVAGIPVAHGAAAEEPATEDPAVEPIDEAPPVDPDEIAVLASGTHAEYCADIYSSQLGSIAEGYHQVTDAWTAVDAGYAASGEPTLLFWRGQLALCLGQKELGQRDLEDFIENLDDEQRKRLSSMVRLAQQRLTRIERGKDEPGGKKRGYQSRKFTVLLEVGPAYGPFQTRETEVVVDSMGWNGYYRVARLEPGWALRISIGFDVRIAKPVTWHLMFGMVTGNHYKDGWRLEATETEDKALEDEIAGFIEGVELGSGEDAIELGKNNWIELHTGPGVLLLPNRQVTPVIRIAAWIRGYPAQENAGYGYQKMHTWTVGGLAAFAGLAVDSPKAPGFSIGVWLAADATDGNVEENNALPDVNIDDLKTAAKDRASVITVFPRVAARFNF